MKISYLRITGFRSIKGPIEIKLPQICAIIGPNNVGKSNILQAIYKVLAKDWVTVNSFDKTDVYMEEEDRDVEIEITFEVPLLYEQYKGIDPIQIPKIKFSYTRYKRGEKTGQRRLKKECLTLNDKPVYIFSKKPQKGEKPTFQPLTTIPQEIQESINLIYIGADRSLKNQLPASRYSLLGSLLTDINKRFEQSEEKLDFKKEDGSITKLKRKKLFDLYIKKAIEVLKTDEFLALEESIKRNTLHQLGFDPDLDTDKLNIYFNPLTSLDFYKSLEIWVNEHGYPINATELGKGFQNVIVIAILKAFEERKKQGAIFLIEEPELYLHPQMQRSLYKTMRKIGETNQVIYVTHSPHFVSIPEFDEIIIVGKNENGTYVTQSSLLPDPKLKEKFRKELDPERNELFFAKRILFVEGDTEKLALPEYAKRMGIDFDKVGASVIEVGGKRNLIDFVDLALSFNIPVGFIYDTDSSDFGKSKKNEEKKYNEMLESYKDKEVMVWHFNKNYEDELKNALGDGEYQKACQKYGKGKPIRARLIAIDEEFDIPEFVKPIINWLYYGKLEDKG